FFSSRRRHTRFSRDWSSDVCSSDLASEINKLFFEVLIAPAYSDAALRILTGKKNRILLRRKQIALPKSQFKTLLNGVIEQDKDEIGRASCRERVERSERGVSSNRKE